MKKTFVYGWNEYNTASYYIEKVEVDIKTAPAIFNHLGQLVNPCDYDLDDSEGGEWYESYGIARKVLIEKVKSDIEIYKDILKSVEAIRKRDL